MQRLDKLELEKGQRQPAPPDMPRPPASAGGATAPSWQQTGIYVPQPRQPQEFNCASGQAQRRGPFFCYNCGEVGDFKRDCPAPVNSGGQPVRLGALVGAVTYQRSPDTHFKNCGVPGWQLAAERVYLRAKIYGRTRLCLLGSGSEVTLIPTGFIGNRKIQWTQRKIWAANCTKIPVKGWISLTAYIDGSCVEVCGLVTDHVSDIFLGLDWLQLNQIEWSFGKGEIIMDGKRHRLVAKKTRGSWCRRVVAESDVVIPALSQFDLSTTAVYGRLPEHSGTAEQVWATEPREIKDGLFVAGTLLPNRATHLPVRVLNATTKPVVVHKEQRSATSRWCLLVPSNLRRRRRMNNQQATKSLTRWCPRWIRRLRSRPRSNYVNY